MKKFIGAIESFLGCLSDKQKKGITWGLAALILTFMFLISFLSSRGAFGIPGDSGTVDEVAHIPSGYSYVKYLDYRLNPEHPPLAKILAGIPLAIDKNIKGLKDNWSWDGINQWDSGWYMLYQEGNDPAEVLGLARFPMILLMLGLGLFLFKWASELFGRKVGLTVLLLYSLYPDIIAHGRLVTTDIAAAFGFVIAIYYFDKTLIKKTKKSIIVAGIAFGLAQLLKFSSFLLFGVFLFLIVARVIIERKEEDWWKNFKKYFLIYFYICALSLLIVWLVYIPFVWKTPVDIEHTLIETNLTSDARTLVFRNFLHHFEGNPITRGLGHYLLGVMLVIARVSGGNATFAMGVLSDKSIPWYFPFAWLVKTPLTIIVLYLGSLFAIIKTKALKNKQYAWTLLLFLMPWLTYWIFTLRGSLDIGIRHLMPTIPFVLLIIGFVLHKVYKAKNVKVIYAVVALIIFMAGSVLSYYPSYLSYFNELVPRDQRYKVLTDSSLDWGQDLLRLKKYVDDNKITSINVDYFGGSVPSFYIPQAKEWHSSYGPTSGYLAVSATYYQSSKLYGPKEGKWSYEWLDSYKPVAQIGGSILIFNVSPEEFRKNPPKASYKITSIDYPTQTKK